MAFVAAFKSIGFASLFMFGHQTNQAIFRRFICFVFFFSNEKYEFENFEYQILYLGVMALKTIHLVGKRHFSYQEWRRMSFIS